MKPSELSDEQLVALVESLSQSPDLEHEDTGPGKFEGNPNPGLTERLYLASLDTSWIDEQIGTVEYGPGWHALIGRFVLIEDSQGFVTSLEYPTRLDAESAFVTVVAEYEAIDAQEDEA